MLKIGLTGSIASGKSTVARMFADLGVKVVDTDVIARRVVEPGSPGLSRLVKEFGRSLLTDNGSLNRRYLGELIFADPEKRQRLNQIMHPMIMAVVSDEMQNYARQHPDGMIMVDVPLLIEANLRSWFDQVVLVYVPVPVQLARLRARDGLDEETAQLRMRSQMSPDEKRHHADFVINNSGSPAATRAQVDKVFHCLQTLSSRAGKGHTCK